MKTSAWLARRIQKCEPVPPGHFALRGNGDMVSLFGAGEIPQAHAEESVWLIAVDHPLRLCIAPSKQSPEAGLSAYIGPVVRSGRLLFAQALGDWLNTIDGDVVTPEILAASISHLAGAALREAMLPGLQPDELAMVKDALNRSIEYSMGLYCEKLFRIDMSSVPATARTPAKPANELPDSATEADAARLIRDFALNETYAERRFFRELPLLCKEIDQRRPSSGQSDQALAAHAKRLHLDFLALAKTRAGRRPQLPATLPLETLLLMATASQRATEGLEMAWQALTPPDTPLDARQVNALASALRQLRLELDRRHTPWWRSAS